MQGKIKKKSRKGSQVKGTASRVRFEQARNIFGIRLILKLYRFSTSLIRAFSRSPIVLSLPLLLLFASIITDYRVVLNATFSPELLFFKELPVPVEDERRAASEEIKKSVQAFLYLVTLGLCLLNWRAVIGYLTRFPHLLILIAFLLTTSIYSVEPAKVVTNSILILISILMPLLFAIGQKEPLKKLGAFYLLALLPILASHLGSLVLLFINDTDPITLIASSNRYGGLSGNPNSLGNTAVLGIWAVVAILLSKGLSFTSKAVSIVALPVFVLSIAMSGSGTATVSSLIVVSLMLWSRVLAAISPTARTIITIVTSVLLICLTLSVFIVVTPAGLFVTFTGSLGKDATLTGRTELWDLAKAAIAERPWLGWSYDTHTSVKSIPIYNVRFHHYHNGFLDTMIAGGILLLVLVFYNLALFIANFKKMFRANEKVFALLVPLILLIVLNMSEYSLLRPLNPIWQLYIGCFVLLTYKFKSASMTKRRSPRKKRQRRRSRSTLPAPAVRFYG